MISSILRFIDIIIYLTALYINYITPKKYELLSQIHVAKFHKFVCVCNINLEIIIKVIIDSDGYQLEYIIRDNLENNIQYTNRLGKVII